VMRSGIGLRGVAQRDPLVEFKREAFLAFDEFRAAVEHQIAELAIRGSVQIELRQPPQQALPQNLHTNAEAIAEASGQAKNAGSTPAPSAPRPAGNASGKAGNRL